MNQIDLNEKVAVITGGAQGIGLAIAERMLDSGASVSLWDRDQKLVEETARSLESRGKAEAPVVDVTDLVRLSRLLKKQKLLWDQLIFWSAMLELPVPLSKSGNILRKNGNR